MKPLKVIKVLNSIPKFQVYSHYGICLDKLFKKKSLKNLIQTLKFNEEYKRKNLNEKALFMSTCDKEKQPNEEILSNFIKNKEETEDIFSLTKLETKPIKQNELSKTKNYSFLFHRKYYDNTLENLDPFRYTPNYNAISKNIPCVRMYKPVSLNKKQTELKNSKNFPKSIRAHILRNQNITLNMQKTEEKTDNSKASHSNNKSKKYKNTLLTEIDYSMKKKNNKSELPSMSSIKVNHKLKISNIKKFSIDKKSINLKLKTCLTETESEKFIQCGKTPICCQFFDKKNKAIDFSKMQSRSQKGLKKHQEITPDAGFYNPNYDYILGKPVNVFINKKPMNKYKFKKIKLNKILTSYHIETNYDIIDNSKLNNNILKKFNI